MAVETNVKRDAEGVLRMVDHKPRNRSPGLAGSVNSLSETADQLPAAHRQIPECIGSRLIETPGVEGGKDMTQRFPGLSLGDAQGLVELCP